MDENIKIKSESYAKRCEICHKKDYFDPRKNYCSRCGRVENLQNDLSENINPNLDAFGRSPIVGYIEVQANVLRERNKNNNNLNNSMDIMSVWVVRGFIAGAVISCVIFLFLSFLVIASYPFTSWGQFIFGLFMLSIYVFTVLGSLGAFVGFIIGTVIALFNSLKKFFSDRKTYRKSYAIL